MRARRAMTVGLTGGVATGKTAVSDHFASLNVPVIDADILAREVVAPGEPALKEIRRQFGGEVIGKGGHLDRTAMRRIIFADPDSRQKLEAIIHPRVRERIFALAAASDAPYCILVVPLLIEVGMHRDVDRVLAVDVSPATQRLRLRRRDELDDAAVERMLAAQVSREERLRHADDIIDNNGSLDALYAQVGELHRKYLALARQLKT